MATPSVCEKFLNFVFHRKQKQTSETLFHFTTNRCYCEWSNQREHNDNRAALQFEVLPIRTGGQWLRFGVFSGPYSPDLLWRAGDSLEATVHWPRSPADGHRFAGICTAALPGGPIPGNKRRTRCLSNGDRSKREFNGEFSVLLFSSLKRPRGH